MSGVNVSFNPHYAGPVLSCGAQPSERDAKTIGLAFVRWDGFEVYSVDTQALRDMGQALIDVALLADIITAENAPGEAS